MMFIRGALGLLLASSTYACFSSSNTTDPNNPVIIGTDGPAPPATIGFVMNHFGLLTSNITAMKHFYGDILGMRTIFDAYPTPQYHITYMGYAQGGRNNSGYQTGEELARNKNNLWGLLELIEFTVSDDHPRPSTERPNTFSHVGLIVPDIKKTQQYLEENDVPILKPFGKPLTETMTHIDNAFGIGKYSGDHAAAKKAMLKAQSIVGIQYFLTVADPEGNMVEIQQQEELT